MRVGVSQFLGHLPAVLAFDRGQQPAQIASHSAAHLGTSKARGNPSRQLSQGRRAPVDDAEVFFPCTPCPFRLFFCSHACSPPPILPSFGDKWDCSTRKVWTFFREGVMSSFPLYFRRCCPRKSKPSSMWVMRVFSGDNSSPRSFMNASMSGLTSLSSGSLVICDGIAAPSVIAHRTNTSRQHILGRRP